MADQKPSIERKALLRILDGDVGLSCKLIDLFLVDGELRVAHLLEALARRDLEDVERTAHAIKGASACLAAIPLSDAARAVERAAREGDMSGAQANGSGLVLEFQRFKEDARKEFDLPPSA